MELGFKFHLVGQISQDAVNCKDNCFSLCVCVCSGAIPGALEAASDQFELQLGSDRHRGR